MDPPMVDNSSFGERLIRPASRRVACHSGMAEPVPPDNKESRLVKERDKYWLTIPYPAHATLRPQEVMEQLRWIRESGPF